MRKNKKVCGVASLERNALCVPLLIFQYSYFLFLPASLIGEEEEKEYESKVYSLLPLYFMLLLNVVITAAVDKFFADQIVNVEWCHKQLLEVYKASTPPVEWSYMLQT